MEAMEFHIKVEDGIISDATFKAFGCGAAIPTGPMVTEFVKGKSIGEALQSAAEEYLSECGALRASPWHHLVSPILFANGGT